MCVCLCLPSFLGAFPFDPLSVQLGLSPSPVSSSPICSFLAKALALLALQPKPRPVGGRDPRCSPHLSSNTVTSCSALLWFLCCLDSES